VTHPPKTADALRRNPLGLFVNAIDWARELDGAPAIPKPSATTTTPPAAPIPIPALAPPIPSPPTADQPSGAAPSQGGNAQ
jgi:type IV secretion system protein VirB5